MPPVRHLNLFQSVFGTSLLSAVINMVLLSVCAFAVWKLLLRPLMCFGLDGLRFRESRGRPLVHIEITPPVKDGKSPEATEALFASFHSMLNSDNAADRFFTRKSVVSLELVSTRDGGIRYIAGLDPADVPQFKQLVISYLPQVRMREVDDYLSGYALTDVRTTEFVSSSHFAFPLLSSDDLSRHDPLAFLTGAMTKPVPGELIAFQLVVSPATQGRLSSVRHQLLQGRDRGLFRSTALGAARSDVRHIFPSGRHRDPSVTPYTEHVLPGVLSKLDQPLFTVSIRALVIGPESEQRMQGIRHALHQYHRPGYQGLVPRRGLGSVTSQLDCFRFRSLSPYILKPTILSSKEIASLYHFPDTNTPSAENLVRSLHSSLPAPLPMKQRADSGEYSIVLGINKYHDQETPVSLTSKEREKHVYLIGGTGNGKTTLMLHAMLQDIRAGRGIAFIDPHGDAAETLLEHIPESRLRDVIYLNPRDITHPVGINLLELPKGLSKDELLLEQERVTEAVVSILRKLFADDLANAHRIESILRNVVRTALTVPDATLFTVLKLLRNRSFRHPIVKNLIDQDLKDFWYEEFNRAGGMQQVSMIKGLTARLDRFRSSAPAYRIFNQSRSTINFEDIINSGKIVICNFSTDMGEDTSALFGTSILAMLKIAAERRIRVAEQSRTPFYVYVDEFQNFATQPFVKMLSGSRKYKLFLTIAEQSTAQQAEPRLTQAILANIGTLICFRTGSPADEHLLLPWFTPFLSEGDISNLPSYHFYLRTRAVTPLEPVSAETILLEDTGDVAASKRVIATSRRRYGILYEDTPRKKQPATKAPKSHPVAPLEKVRDHIPKPTIDDVMHA